MRLVAGNQSLQGLMLISLTLSDSLGAYDLSVISCRVASEDLGRGLFETNLIIRLRSRM
jgi:hypothetical protein